MEKKETITQEKQESWLNSDIYLEKLKELGAEKYVEAYKEVLGFSEAIRKNGGRALLVGGCTRDMVLQKVSKDFDIEVYGLEAKTIEEIAENYGNVSSVGKAFGILKIFINSGICLDVSLPRTDSKIGEGHKGFNIKTDPHMSIEDAAKRRDFTINSMAFDPLENELFDPYDGKKDLENKILRATDSERFKDDPLRVLRAFQFASRFGMKIDEDTKEIIREIMPNLRELPGERLGAEWKKLLLKSEKPSIGLRQAMELGLFEEIHPEFAKLPETEQDKRWHPEGNVWEHTLQSVDATSMIVRREGFDLNTESKESNFALGIVMAALCHDLGKPETTKIHKDGKITSYDHETAGIKPSKTFLSKIRLDYETRDRVLMLVEKHMRPLLWYREEIKRKQPIRDKTIRKLARNIWPSNIRELALVSEADYRGRTLTGDPDMETKFPQGKWLMERATALNVDGGPAPHLIKGQDFIDLGYKEGAEIGQLINLSNNLRDNRQMDKEQILEELRYIEGADEAIKKLRQVLSDK